MYTQYEAHIIAEGLKHLEGKSFFRPENGLFYEVLDVLPVPCDEEAHRKMLGIFHQLASFPRTISRDALGNYMMTVKGEFDVMAVGATEDNGVAVFHCVPIELVVNEVGLGYEFVP